MDKKRSTFSGSLGFIMAAAGSAVGLGNIWRFPYLAAKGGGGLFLVIYLVLALTFGFTLLMSEISIGRKTKQSSMTAYGVLNGKFKWLGIVASLVPFLIFTYYCAIGGWVLKYFITFITGQGAQAAEESYFGGFISGITQPIVFNIIFLAATAFVVFMGVSKGIESISKILMPVLIVLVIAIAIFAVTIKSGDRTGLQGLKYFIVPSIEGKSLRDIIGVVVDAMNQLFFSISVAMGIMITYGSYLKDEDNLVKSVNRIELFDTGIAVLAGIMIIPTVYVFMGEEGMSAHGAGLMFVAIPKIFNEMGTLGTVIGAAFFLMVLFAALTSSISILEAIVSSFMDQFNISRSKATAIESGIALVLSTLICLGYNLLYFEVKLPNSPGSNQLLDVVDYLSNNLLMPIVSIGTCILIGWVMKPKTVIDEATKNGEKFGRKKMYEIMIKYVTPILLFILLMKSLGLLDIIFDKIGLE